MQIMENQKANWEPREWKILACNWCFHEFLLQQMWKIAAENFVQAGSTITNDNDGSS